MHHLAFRGHDLISHIKMLVFFHLAFVNFLSDRLPFTYSFGKVWLSAFFSLEVRCKMLIQLNQFKCKCSLSYCKWTSSGNMNSTKNMNPLISIPLDCLSESKATAVFRCIHFTDHSHHISENLTNASLSAFMPLWVLVNSRLIHHEQNRKEGNSLHQFTHHKEYYTAWENICVRSLQVFYNLTKKFDLLMLP